MKRFYLPSSLLLLGLGASLGCAGDSDVDGPTQPGGALGGSSGSGGTTSSGGSSVGGTAGSGAGSMGGAGAQASGGMAGSGAGAGTGAAAGAGGSSGSGGTAGAAGNAGSGGTGGTGGTGGAGGGTGGTGGACDGCLIGANCIEPGEPDLANPCQACLPSLDTASYSMDPSNVTCGATGYWTGVARNLATSPYGNIAAISCHNCYTGDLAGTLAKIHTALTDGADLIELDIKDEAGTAFVDHDDAGSTSGPLLNQVLADSVLKAADQPLFIEIKETVPTDAFIARVLDALIAEGYGVPGRPVVLRAFESLTSNLLIARKLLATPAYLSLRPHVRLNVLFTRADGADIPGLQTRIATVRNAGGHGVEFEYQTPNLFGALTYARSLGLGTSIYTVPVGFGEVFVSNARDEVDAITVDYPVASARAVVEANNALAYLSAWDQNATASTINWLQSSSSATSASPVNTSGAPTLENLGAGSNRFGTSLDFNAAGSEFVSLYDADNPTSQGYFVAVVVSFDNLAIASTATSVLLGKANAAAFSLELHNPSGSAATVLRFGAHVGGSYLYATYPASNLDTTSSYLITAAYDGDGAVRMWINNSDAGVTPSASVTGGVTTNDVPILIGADPESPGERFFFDGKIQLALVQSWANH